MALPGWFEPRVAQRASAGVLSAALHLSLILVIVLSGGRQDGIDSGETPTTQLILLEAPDADHRDGVDLPPLEPVIPTSEIEEQLRAENAPPAASSAAEIAVELEDVPEDVEVASNDEPPSPPEAIEDNSIELIPALVMPHAEQAELSKRLARVVEESFESEQTQVSWEQDGKQYSATLIRERANDGTALDRVIAEVSASDHGRQLTTRVQLKRLAFSQFTQMVDHWDPMVQLHDDEIVGRFHTQLAVQRDVRLAHGAEISRQGDDRRTHFQHGVDRPQAGGGHLPGRRRDTRRSHPLCRRSCNRSNGRRARQNARMHEFANDTRIRFFADGSYTWRTRRFSRNATTSTRPPIIPCTSLRRTARRCTCKASSPARSSSIRRDGSCRGQPHVRARSARLTRLARLPGTRLRQVHRSGAARRDRAGRSRDRRALSLPGAASWCRTSTTRRSATLRIYGSLAAGSLSASEPRYATKIEYDERFERRRPPGFPSTNRYEVDALGRSMEGGTGTIGERSVLTGQLKSPSMDFSTEQPGGRD